MLIVFLVASAFNQTAGSVSLFIAKSLGCNLDKEKPSKAVALQFPCTGNEKEEKKAEQMSLVMSLHLENLYSKHRDRSARIRHLEVNTPARAVSPIFLLNKSLRL